MRNSLLSLVFLLVSCGGEGPLGVPGTKPPPVQHAPEISQLAVLPDQVTYMDGGGSIVVTVQLSFVDVGSDLQTLWVRTPDGTSLEFDKPTSTATGTLIEEFTLSTEAVGLLTMEFWLVDKAGDSSKPVSANIQVAPAVEPDTFPVLVTRTIDGLQPNGPSVNGGLDWMANHVIFASKASNLVAGDTNNAWDLFIRKTCLHENGGCTPVTTRAVTGLGGAEPNGNIGWTITSPDDALSVSFNGRFVAFISSASNLVANDTNGVDDVFLVDTCIDARTACTPGVVRVSLRNDGSQSVAPARHPAVANDGRYVVFVSADPNLVAGDSNGVADVFLRDTCLGADVACSPGTTRVSVANNGGQANAASGEPAFTGRYVAFTSNASNLVTADPNGVQDVFLRDTCLGEPGCIPSTRLVSIGRLGDPADGASWDPQVSWDLADFYGHDQHGRFVAFVSAATNLVANDSNGAADVFERDLCAGEPGCTPSTARISVTSNGGQIMGDSWSPDFLRWDGETLPFVTAADGVVSSDANALVDVYLRHHCPIGAPDYCVPITRRISVGAAGAQTDGDSYAPRMSHDPFGAWAITYISKASNILPNGVPIPNDGNIYLDLAY